MGSKSGPDFLPPLRRAAQVYQMTFAIITVRLKRRLRQQICPRAVLLPAALGPLNPPPCGTLHPNAYSYPGP